MNDILNGHSTHSEHSYLDDRICPTQNKLIDRYLQIVISLNKLWSGPQSICTFQYNIYCYFTLLNELLPTGGFDKQTFKPGTETFNSCCDYYWVIIKIFLINSVIAIHQGNIFLFRCLFDLRGGLFRICIKVSHILMMWIKHN